MTAADRTRRQREADHAGREARIEAVTRDLLADADYYAAERGHFRPPLHPMTQDVVA